MTRYPVAATAILAALIGQTVGCDAPRPPAPRLDRPPAGDPPTADAAGPPASTEIPAAASPTPDEPAVHDTPPAPTTPRSAAGGRTAPRPLPEDGPLLGAGLTVLRSTSVRLITDVSTEEAAGLLPFADAAFAALPAAFGPVADEDRSTDTPPVTAMPVRAEDRLRSAGLLRGPLPTNIHGRHEGWRFWMRWPRRDYYRRHLMAHEMAHCWTMAAGGRAPDALLEGMAEWFATHRVAGEDVAFGVLPAASEEVRGWGRIEMFTEAAASDPKSAAEVARLPSAAFTGRPTAYAWAWAWCAVAARAPATASSFQSLVRDVTAGRPARAATQSLAESMDDSGLWSWWRAECDYGVDPAVCAPAAATRDGDAWTVVARGGWQETDVRLEPGEAVRIEAGGLAVTGQGDRPWTSTPAGVRLDYAGGVPVGTLMACLRDRSAWSPPRPVGAEGEVSFAGRGVLCLRVNDAWAEIADNAGGYRVVVRPAATPPGD